jgi:hypothetical protein
VDGAAGHEDGRARPDPRSASRSNSS